MDTVLLRALPHRDPVPAIASAVSALARGGLGWHGASLALVVRPGTSRRMGLAGSAAWTAAGGVAQLVKVAVGRRRPRLAAVGSAVHSSSMPSSHTATAAAYATAVALQHPAGAVAALPAAAVAWSRLATRRHFPTDVVAGAALGVLVGGVVGLAVRRARPVSPPPGAGRSTP